MTAGNGNNRPQYAKILEIGPIPPPRAGWGVRIEYLLASMSSGGIECAALDVGANRKVRRKGCDDVQSACDYARKVFGYLRRGYRIHSHLNAESPKAYLLVLVSSVLSCLFGRRSVLTWHGGVPQRWFPRGKNKLVDLVHRVIFGLHQRIICNDDRIKRHIVDYGVPGEKITPIPAFSRQYVQYRTVDLPAPLQAFLADRTPRLFTYVYFRPEFYLPVLVEALATIADELPAFGIVVVGHDEGADDARERIRAAGIQDHVYFAGDLDRDSFLTLLGGSDICIRTPKRDGISSSVLEALALNVPVVAADNPLRPEQAVTYPADDADALAAAVIRVLNAPLDQRRPDSPEIPDTVAREVEILTN